MEIDSFFCEISPLVIGLVSKGLGSNRVVSRKDSSSNFATAIDIAVEREIVTKIREYFPDDAILAEEENATGSLSEGRIWIIDPICGTNNLARGVGPYCTNIALAKDGALVASCVIEHPSGKYYWSIGSGIHEGMEIWEKPNKVLPDTRIDIDVGNLTKVHNKQVADRWLKGVRYFYENTDYIMGSLDSSVELLYVMLGKLDGMVFVHTDPWDTAAGAFLVKQSGGIVTNLDGKDWGINCDSVIAAGDSQTHRTMLRAFSVDNTQPTH